MNIKPLKDLVLVNLAPPKDKEGSIFLPSEREELSRTEGVVLAVGPQCKEVTIGDKIIIPAYGGLVIDQSNPSKRIFKETDIIGIIV